MNLQEALKEIERLKKINHKPISFKVSQKGAVSVYGMGRFPVTLYQEQWERLLAPEQVKALLQFIKDNESSLKKKGEAVEEKQD